MFTAYPKITLTNYNLQEIKHSAKTVTVLTVLTQWSIDVVNRGNNANTGTGS